MIGSLGVLSWLQSNVRKLMQKATSPNYNPDTDSNEAIRERIDALLDAQVPESPTAGSLRDILNKDTERTFSRATDSLEAIRDKIDTLPTSGAVSSVASATASGTVDGTGGSANWGTVNLTAAAQSWSSWVEYITSTSEDLWLALCSIHAYVSGTSDSANTRVQIGIGASGSEVPIVTFPTAFLPRASTAGIYQTNAIFSLPIPVKIPSGSRIAVRAFCQGYSGNTHYASVSLGFFHGLET